MKSVFLALCLAVTFFSPSAFAGDARYLMIVEGGTSSVDDTGGVDIKDNFLATIQVYLLSLYAIVAVGAFIYIGFRLFNAQGNEAEFNSAWIALVYTVVGLALAPLAYLIVQVVTGFTISSS